jgi:hypothetical protein
MKMTQKYFRFFASLIIAAALCFGSQTSALAQSQAQGEVDTISPPLFPDLTWKDSGLVEKDVNAYGQTLTLSGNMFEAVETFQGEIPESVFDYYSAENLQSLGWNFVGNKSFESAYWHSSGKYLTVQIMECAASNTEYCVNVWQSETTTPPAEQLSTASVLPATVDFHKITPANGSTVSFSTSYRFLTWSDAEIGSGDRYEYCLDESNNSQCNSDEGWRERNSLYSGGPGDFTLYVGHTYYWQVRVRDDGRTANSGTWWSFTVGSATTGPTVSSVVRSTPTSAVTNASSVIFKVTFSQSVTGVSADGSDFALATSGIAGPSITSVTGSGAVYTVTVNTGSGNGTIHLDVIDDDSIINSSNVPLGGAGANNGNYTSGQTYTIDRVAPQVLSSVLANASPTKLASVSFTVTFSESVTGVDAADFYLTRVGITGGAITAISGSGSTRTVTVSTGSDSGELRLNVIDNDTIVDAAGNKLGGTGAGNGNYTIGQTYIIDREAPSVSLSLRDYPNPTNLSSVSFSVYFSEIVTGVDSADFSLTTTGITGAKITSISGADDFRTVTVSTGVGNGTLHLNVKDNDTILDEAGNKLGGTGTGNGNYTAGETYTIDKTVPTVVSSTLINLSPTNFASVNFTVTFSESVTGVDAPDFSLTTTGSLAGTAITGVSGSGTTRTVTVSTGTGSGLLRLDVIDDDSIIDGTGNELGGTGANNGNFTAGQAYVIDRSAPTVVSSVRANPNPTNLSSVNFTVTFSEVVTGVDETDFSLATTGIAGASITSVSGSGAIRTVTVNTGTGSGALRLKVIDDDTIFDILGYVLGGAGAGNGDYAGQTYTIDKAVPTVVSSVRVNPSRTNLASVKFTVTFSEAVTGVDAADFSVTRTGITSAVVTAVSGSGATRTVTVSTGSGNGTLRLNVVDNDTILDATGYKLGGTGKGNGSFTGGQTYTIDKTVPKVVSSVLVSPSPTNLASVKFTVKFSEAVTGVDSADFNLTTTGITGAAVSAISGSGATYTVTVSTGTGNGTLRLNVRDNDTILDAAGNKLGGTGVANGNYIAGQSYTIEKTAPKVISSLRANPNPTSLASVSFAVRFSELVTGVDVSDFSLTTTGVAGASITSVSGSGSTRTVTVNTGTGNGTLRLNVVDDDTIRDAVGNKLGGTGSGNGDYTAGQTYTVTKTTVAVSSVTINSDATANSSGVDFTVTFSEAVTGVDAADFRLTSNGITDALITNVTGSGTSYVVSVSTDSGSGNLRLDVLETASIQDMAGTPLTGNYTGGEVYSVVEKVVEKVAPDTQIDSAPLGSSNSTSATFTFSSPDGTATFECSLDGSAYAACASPVSYADLAEGSHSFEVRAADPATNVDASPASFTWTIDTATDTTAPTVVSSLPVSTDPTDAASVDFIVTFSEAVTGVDAADFSLISAEIADATITTVSGSGTTYTVTISTGTGSGALRLDVVDDDTILDEAGNPLGDAGLENGGYIAGQPYTISKP